MCAIFIFHSLFSPAAAPAVACSARPIRICICAAAWSHVSIRFYICYICRDPSPCLRFCPISISVSDGEGARKMRPEEHRWKCDLRFEGPEMHDARLRHICSIVLVLPDGSKSFDDKDVYSWISALVFGTGGFEHIFFPLCSGGAKPRHWEIV